MKGQLVLIRIYGQNRKWTYGTILKPTGPVSYIVKLPNGKTWRRHQDQLKACSEQITPPHQSVTHDITPTALLTTPSFRKKSLLQTVPSRVSVDIQQEFVILQANIPLIHLLNCLLLNSVM